MGARIREIKNKGLFFGRFHKRLKQGKDSVYICLFSSRFSFGQSIEPVSKRNENYDVHRKMFWAWNTYARFHKTHLYYLTTKTRFVQKVLFVLLDLKISDFGLKKWCFFRPETVRWFHKGMFFKPG